VIKFEQGQAEVGMSMLENYGAEYPESPDPESYALLIKETIAPMSSTVQATMQRVLSGELETFKQSIFL